MKIDQYKKDIESWLTSYFEGHSGYNRKIYEAMGYSINIGGKRIRPILLLLAYKLYKENYKSALPAACAVEMIHTYSLIHDDLPCMDNDDLRRGMPTSHKVYGEAIAVLAGDALLNEAMAILFEVAALKGSEGVKAGMLISKAAGAEGMIAGQLVDMLNEGKVCNEVQEEELLYMHNKKTGELIKAPILAGALLGGAAQEDLHILQNYGEKLGLAFQIKDDILDVVGDTVKLGKKVNSDIENNKVTFVNMFGLKKCIKKCSELTDECMILLGKLNKDTADLKDLTAFLLNRDY